MWAQGTFQLFRFPPEPPTYTVIDVLIGSRIDKRQSSDDKVKAVNDLLAADTKSSS